MNGPISAPGVVLGRYPEQRPRDTATLWERLAGSLRRLGHRAQQHRVLEFVNQVRALQPALAGESDTRLRERTLHLRAQLARDGFAGDALTEAFAVVAAACLRHLGVALYDSQLFTARVMLDGQLAEMATGEGKTLAAGVVAATAALAGIPVHVVTANDYLVERDAASLRALYAALDLTVGAVTQPLPAAARRAAYACDITYCTAKELVFDYLRDGVAAPRRGALEQRAAELSGAPTPQRLLRGLNMAIIDEADSILIDEARVPLVLSQSVAGRDANSLRGQLLVPKNLASLPSSPALLPEGEGRLVLPAAREGSWVGEAQWRQAWTLSAGLESGTDFHADPSTRSVRLTAAGRARLRSPGAPGAPSAADSSPWLNARQRDDAVILALTARHMLRRGRDYVVEAGRVHIVDETTGRKAAGRSWSQGLHQWVEIKEGCAPSAPVATLAQITYQRFFPRYLRLCGMSGTLTEARRELQAIYDLPVVKVPLRLPNRRQVLPPRVYANADAQWRAVAARVREWHEQGRPLLVGTDSVLDTQALSRQLAAHGLPHAVLNAHHDRHEAQVVAAAGARGAITVATHMAGRGTDIVLDAASRDAGGLHIICCQQNAARRIDRQVLGRSARQGDPGSAEYFVSLQGPLLSHQHIVKKLFKNKYLRFSGLTMLVLRLAQRSAERQARRERETLMRRDRQMNDWFAFSGSEQ